MQHSLARRIAEDLLDIEAVSFARERPFVWASGLRAPIYCDNRQTISYPVIRRRIRDGFLELIGKMSPKPAVIVGTATAGIPHAAWLAEELDLPMAYVRSKPKDHGRGSLIEGRVDEGQHVVVIEDLISTGGSSNSVVDVLRSAGAAVDAVLAIFSYELPDSRQAFNAADIPLETLTNFETLLQVALERDILTSDMVESVTEWKDDPMAWSDRHK